MVDLKNSFIIEGVITVIKAWVDSKTLIKVLKVDVLWPEKIRIVIDFKEIWVAVEEA